MTFVIILAKIIGNRVLKGPSRTKNTTESEFRYREQIRYGGSKTLLRGLRNACFCRHKSRKASLWVKGVKAHPLN